MAKIILTREQVYELVTANRYKFAPQNRFNSRCIDGRYLNSPDLNPLAAPGADAGELMVLYAAANQYGFAVQYDNALMTLMDIVGHDNFSWHSDTHESKKNIGSGCGHLKQLRQDPADYHLEKEQLDLLTKQLETAATSGSKETVLQGDHLEGAVIQVTGNYSLMPQFTLEIEDNEQAVQVFVYQKTLADERRKLFAQKLIENNAVVLYDTLDQEYLYEVIADTAEEHLFETAKRLAKGLPLIGIDFSTDGSFKLEDLGIVQ